MSKSEDEPLSSQEGISLYVVWNMRECPRKLLKRGDSSEGHFSYHFSLPLPTQIVVFALGKWDDYPANSQIEIDVCLDSDFPSCRIGTLTKDNTSFCWEGVWTQPFLDKSLEIDEQHRLAKITASITEETFDEEKENKLDQSSAQNKQHNKKQGSKAESPTSRTTKQLKLSFSGGKKNIPRETEEAVEAKEDKTLAKNGQQRSFATVFGKKRRSIPNSPASKRWKSTPSDKKHVNKSPPQKSPGLPTPPDTPSQSEGTDAPSGRWGHAVVVLNNQKVLVAGGQGAKQQIVKDSLWLLDTESGNWTQQNCEEGGAERRMGHTVTYDPDQQVLYVYGGSKNKRWYSDIHVLDTTTWTWSALEATGLAPRRAYHSCTLFADELFVFGGVFPNPDPQPDGCSNDLFAFLPKNKSWYKPIVNGQIPSPRSGHSASLLGDLLVIFGGWDSPLCFNDLFFLNMPVMEFLKPAITGIPPSPRSWHANTILPGQRVFIHGGYDGDRILSDSFVFDLETISWTAVKTPGTLNPRAGHVAFCLPAKDDKHSEEQVTIFGGGDNAGQYFNDYLTFTPSNTV